MNWLILASPFLIAIAILAIGRGADACHRRRDRKEREALEAKQKLYNVLPFRGSKEFRS